jgi:hypothetical protein
MGKIRSERHVLSIGTGKEKTGRNVGIGIAQRNTSSLLG